MIHVLGLNLDRWRLEHEANTVRHTMTHLFVAAFPKEKVIIDPLVQARQKVVALKQDAGQASPEEFTSLVGQINQAWANTKNGIEPEIASLEYRDHSMFMHIKSDRSIDPVWLDQFKTELRTRHLAWAVQEAGIWHIQIAQ